MITTGDKAIQALIAYIKSYASIPSGVGVFAYEKDKDFDGDYIVVNHLPFSTDHYDVQTATFNVNIHAKDRLKGGINVARLNDLTDKVKILFDEDIFLEGYWFSITYVSMPYVDDDKTHFVNIKFNVNYSNFQ